MQPQPTRTEQTDSDRVSVLPTDTLFYALQVMQAYGRRLLPVLDAERTLVGLLAEARLLDAWRADPLLLVCEVMAPHPAPGVPWLPGEGPETRVVTAAQALECGELAGLGPGEGGPWSH